MDKGWVDMCGSAGILAGTAGGVCFRRERYHLTEPGLRFPRTSIVGFGNLLDIGMVALGQVLYLWLERRLVLFPRQGRIDNISNVREVF